MKNKRLTIKKKNSLTGHIFVLPFYIGFLLFFLRPLIQSLKFVFSDVSVNLGGYAMKYVGLKNLNYVLKVDTTFSEQLLSSTVEMCWKTIVIIVASLFLAIMIRPKFLGRSFVRAIFFLPVIIASGIVIKVMQNDVAVSSMLSGDVVTSGNLVGSNALENLFLQAGFSTEITSFFTLVSSNIFSILWKTGIQTIVFLAALQSIPQTLYEASSVEGSTAWEDFWKITLPMITPIILLNLVYTIVDCFTDSSNVVMQKVTGNISKMNLDWAAAMSWIYFLLIAVILVIVFSIFNLINRPSKRRD